jgi:transcriptional regulator NrdR family protein
MSKSTKDYDYGIECPGCGCKHHATKYTRKRASGRVMRRRICRNCGREFTTYETRPGRQGESKES